MKAKIGYIRINLEEGETPEFRKSLSRWDSDGNWQKIVYFEVEDDD